jgi:hypothetical protein
MAPYVSLNNIDPIKKPFYICGVTNTLFLEKKGE